MLSETLDLMKNLVFTDNILRSKTGNRNQALVCSMWDVMSIDAFIKVSHYNNSGIQPVNKQYYQGDDY